MSWFFWMLAGCNSQTKVVSEPDGAVTQDLDGDGFEEGEDCDDSDASIYPSATELCDGLDNNCDGEIDEGVTTTFYSDQDGDGFGSAADETEACEAPEGFVAIGTDCDDGNDAVYPAAEEVCDGLDNDCNDEIDEGLGTIYYQDQDGDGFGDAEVEACSLVDGLVSVSGDCNDEDVNIAPNAIEECDEIDNNCNGQIDEGVTTTYYLDGDTDGFGDPDIPVEACQQPEDAVENAQDCNDVDSFINPSAAEICDEIDNNCNGSVDESGALNELIWYSDGDGDGYGDPDDSLSACAQPSNYVSNSNDCNDGNNEVSPAQNEVCNNGKDDNCDGQENEQGALGGTIYYQDGDGDGFGDPLTSLEACTQPSGYTTDGTDCNDGDEDVYVGASEICDGKDNNCDGSVDENVGSTFYLDGDGDGYGDASQSQIACSVPSGYVATDTDCDDGSALISPAASEECDGIDNDCDGNTDESDAIDQSVWFVDVDGDGYGSSQQTSIACNQPSGFVSNSSDCNDGASAISPLASEECDGVDNDCDGNTDESDAIDQSVWYLDGDGDGYGSSQQTSTACNQPTGFVSNSSDCNDGTSAISPSASEVCDGVDNNCDGVVDQGSNISTSTYYQDLDGDGFGDVNQTQVSCSHPSGYVTTHGDCNDSNADINPNEDDICDGVDNDCSGTVDDDPGYLGLDEVCAADSCLDIKDQYPQSEDGVYWVDPAGTGAHEVYCDQTTDGGGWNLISVVRNNDATQVIVGNAFCTSLSTNTNCKGHMTNMDATVANEVLVYDLDSNNYIIYEGFETNGAFGYFTLNKQLVYSSSCSGFNHTCGSRPDPNLSIAVTSGYTYNYNPPLYQWWRYGGWWVGASPDPGNAGRVHGTSYAGTHDFRNRSNAGSGTGQQSSGHQALYFR